MAQAVTCGKGQEYKVWKIYLFFLTGGLNRGKIFHFKKKPFEFGRLYSKIWPTKLTNHSTCTYCEMYINKLLLIMYEIPWMCLCLNSKNLPKWLFTATIATTFYFNLQIYFKNIILSWITKETLKQLETLEREALTL